MDSWDTEPNKKNIGQAKDEQDSSKNIQIQMAKKRKTPREV